MRNKLQWAGFSAFGTFHITVKLLAGNADSSIDDCKTILFWSNEKILRFGLDATARLLVSKEWDLSGPTMTDLRPIAHGVDLLLYSIYLPSR